MESRVPMRPELGSFPSKVSLEKLEMAKQKNRDFVLTLLGWESPYDVRKLSWEPWLF